MAQGCQSSIQSKGVHACVYACVRVCVCVCADVSAALVHTVGLITAHVLHALQTSSERRVIR